MAKMGRHKGFKQPLEIRIKIGDGQPNFKGNDVSRKTASRRARKFYPKVPKGYVRHHIDGDPYNNVIENIEVITYREHRERHRVLNDPVK